MHKNITIFVVALILLFGGGFWYRYRQNATDERGATKLMRSFEEEETDQQKLIRLIRHTDNVNERDKSGRTALFYAARRSTDAEPVSFLLRMGADLSVTDELGQTSLMTAVRYNSSEKVLAQLLVAGAPINAADHDGFTALMIAARHNTPGIVKKLVRAGADPDIKNKEGKTAADFLAENKKFSEEEKNDFLLAFKVLSIIGPHPRGFISGEKK